ncbi:MAG: hypothetical protein GY943_20655 [Chloroflexi bacterium]|nr:hypothetical protein [Chloroflexota bacterium]
MKAYRIKKKVSHQGKIQLDALPFAVGEVVEIIVLESVEQDIENNTEDISTGSIASLKGSVLEYLNPTEPVAQDDWTATQ